MFRRTPRMPTSSGKLAASFLALGLVANGGVLAQSPGDLPSTHDANDHRAGSHAAFDEHRTSQPTPNPKYLVPATGPCPALRDGFVVFAPDGVKREVRVFMSEKALKLHGPLVFSWHATGEGASNAIGLLGNDVIEEIKSQGGTVVAPLTGYGRERRPWDNIPSGPTDTDGDQRLMDEVVACAIAEAAIDVRRIHSVGWSAGGFKTAQVSLRRSGYIASVVIYSGGLTGASMPPDQDPENRFAAMVLFGGSGDISAVDGIAFAEATQTYVELLASKGRDALVCDHGAGHAAPPAFQRIAWQFLQDHPFGTTPSPYVARLPSSIGSICSMHAR
jgi:dienelactone hydrolase